MVIVSALRRIKIGEAEQNAGNVNNSWRRPKKSWISDESGSSKLKTQNC